MARRKKSSMTPQRRKFKAAAKYCERDVAKSIAKEPRKNLFKEIGKCMKRALRK